MEALLRSGVGCSVNPKRSMLTENYVTTLVRLTFYDIPDDGVLVVVLPEVHMTPAAS